MCENIIYRYVRCITVQIEAWTNLYVTKHCQSYCFYMMCASIKQNKQCRIGYITCQALSFLNTTSYNLLITRKVCELLIFQLPYTHKTISLCSAERSWRVSPVSDVVWAPWPSGFLLCSGYELTGQNPEGRWEGHQPCLLYSLPDFVYLRQWWL